MKIWIFWEGNKPAIVELCIASIEKYHEKDFEIIQLNLDNISEYIPKDLILLIKEKTDRIQHFADIIRVYLLKNYGGVWLDADILFFGSLLNFTKYLGSDIDFIGFGFTGNQGFYNYGTPSNWCMIVSPGCKLFQHVWKIIEDQVLHQDKNDRPDYHTFGKLLIWKSINELNYKYLHVSTCFDGSRDKNGHWVSMDRIEKAINIPYSKFFNDKRIFLVLYHSEMSQSFKEKTIDELLRPEDKKMKFITKMLYRSLNTVV